MPTINKRGIDTIMSLKKKIAAAFIACAMTLAVVPSAFACTALYVGSDLTEDGTTMFGRIEDLGTNDYNKLFNISTAGKHTAGEVYEQVGRRKLVHDTIRHGRFTIIVNRGIIAFIKQNKGTLYKLHPLLTIQYKIQ